MVVNILILAVFVAVFSMARLPTLRRKLPLKVLDLEMVSVASVGRSAMSISLMTLRLISLTVLPM